MTITEDVKIDKSQIEKQVRDWKKRIADLYKTIKAWTKQTEYSIKNGTKLTMYEELMALSNVPPAEVETADIYKDGKIILSFKPKGLWIIGVNGAIEILSEHGSYMLIDRAEQFNTPKWKIYHRDRGNGIDFNKKSLFQLL